MPVASRVGFTIVEMLVVMAIIALLVSLALPAITRVRATSRKVSCLNNLRNVALALVQTTDAQGRFPAAGLFGPHPVNGGWHNYHSWVVEVLPRLEQGNIANQWKKALPVDDANNRPLGQLSIPVLICPVDISRSEEEDQGDLSYVVNGGVGFPIAYGPGVHDCFVDTNNKRLDLNGNGVLCPPPKQDLMLDGDPSDRKMALWMGLFFSETIHIDYSVRHHRMGTVSDGLSQTMLASENVRSGFDPTNPISGWAHPNPRTTSFYIGNPCPAGDCAAGVDYSRSNAGAARINSGLWSPEGSSPVPNSLHDGGVNMTFCDARVTFLSEGVDGAVYAALASPAGHFLDGTPLSQRVVSALGP